MPLLNFLEEAGINSGEDLRFEEKIR